MSVVSLVPGAVFDTPFESGCVALEEPDVDGNFLGRDSDGVECQFNVVMIERVEVVSYEGNEDGSNRDVPPFDNDPRTDEEIKQAVYDRADDFLDGWDV